MSTPLCAKAMDDGAPNALIAASTMDTNRLTTGVYTAKAGKSFRPVAEEVHESRFSWRACDEVASFSGRCCWHEPAAGYRDDCRLVCARGVDIRGRGDAGQPPLACPGPGRG